MVSVTNNIRETVDLLLKGKPKNGIAPTGSVAPGETEDLDVDTEHASFKGKVFAGVISVPDSVSRKVESSVEATPPVVGKNR